MMASSNALTQWGDPIFCMAAVRENGLNLKEVLPGDQTREMCLEAVKQNPNALEFCAIQTPDICCEAVSQDGMTLRFVKKQSELICRMAIDNNDSAMDYVDGRFRYLLTDSGYRDYCDEDEGEY